jgi:OOP family OmpA-OmpF porin
MPIKTAAKACFMVGSLLATPVLAQSWDGQTYLTLQGGVAQQDEHRFTAASGAKIQTQMKDGYVVVGAVGRQYGNVRAELEGSYRTNEVDRHRTTGPALAGSSGKARVFAGMGNFYYDLITGGDFTPYLGTGLGVAHVQLEKYATTANGTLLDDGATVLAYQGIAGVNYRLTTNLSLNAEYRYFATTNVDVQSGAQKSSIDYHTHNLLAGLRYLF